MYHPIFTITQEILKNIGLVEAAREVIVNAPLIPVYEAKFVKEAVARTVHHTTHLEVASYDLSLNEVRKAIEGEQVVARERDIQEVINYRNVIRFIEQLAPNGKRETRKPPDTRAKLGAGHGGIGGNTEGLRYAQSMLKEINRIACERIITDGWAGKYRQTQVILRNSATGEVVFRPPPAVEVHFLLEDFFAWLNSATSKKVHPVLRAGVAHYYLVATHPFVEANGRSARAFATLILFAEDYDIRKFFSLEEYFDKDALNYYRSLMAVDKQHQELAKRDLTLWLEYFTQAMAVELTRIKEKVKSLSVDLKIKGRVGHQIPLNERQIKLVEYLEEHGSITTGDARKIVPQYSDDTIVRDFNYFIQKGLVKKTGKTKAARYIMK